MSVTLEECMIMIREHGLHPDALQQVCACAWMPPVLHTLEADAGSDAKHWHSARERPEEHWRAPVRIQHATMVCTAQAVPPARGDLWRGRGVVPVVHVQCDATCFC